VQLEELGLLGRRADNKALLQMYHNTHLATNEHYSKPRFEAPEFIVHHFAGQVTVSCLLVFLYTAHISVCTMIVQCPVCEIDATEQLVISATSCCLLACYNTLTHRSMQGLGLVCTVASAAPYLCGCNAAVPL
jgi:hypothetical protein